MMRGVRRLVVYAAVVGLLAGGMISATLETAHADTVVTTCGANQANSFICPLDATISAPGSISVSVDSGVTSENVNVGWTVTCTDSTGTVPQAGATDNAATPLTVALVPLPSTADGQCSVTVDVTLPKPDPLPAIDFNGTLSYAPPGSSSPSSGGSASVRPVKGFHGMCVDDKGNSSANRAKVIIWTCSGTDQAQSWKFSNGEFIHNGKCLNDQGNGGIRSHLILWSCNGASNEKWSELVNGELKLQSHGGTLCLDDPRSSTANGTQLIVYTCTDSANQKWSLP
jgi:Ricin-type beta-trefoil lectin domain